MARPKSNVYMRFESKVKIMENGCHEWQSTLNRGGYGKFYYEGKQEPAHRVSYLIYIGDLNGKWVLHKCDNRKCVNPSHLFLGTCKDNISDMDNKKRRGTKSKVTADQAEQIKKMYKDRISQQKIGEIFGLDQTTISRIVLGKNKFFKENHHVRIRY